MMERWRSGVRAHGFLSGYLNDVATLATAVDEAIGQNSRLLAYLHVYAKTKATNTNGVDDPCKCNMFAPGWLIGTHRPSKATCVMGKATGGFAQHAFWRLPHGATGPMAPLFPLPCGSITEWLLVPSSVLGAICNMIAPGVTATTGAVYQEVFENAETAWLATLEEPVKSRVAEYYATMRALVTGGRRVPATPSRSPRLAPRPAPSSSSITAARILSTFAEQVDHVTPDEYGALRRLLPDDVRLAVGDLACVQEGLAYIENSINAVRQQVETHQRGHSLSFVTAAQHAVLARITHGVHRANLSRDDLNQIHDLMASLKDLVASSHAPLTPLADLATYQDRFVAYRQRILNKRTLVLGVLTSIPPPTGMRTADFVHHTARLLLYEETARRRRPSVANVTHCASCTHPLLFSAIECFVCGSNVVVVAAGEEEEEQ
jgi:hypothetical protein